MIGIKRQKFKGKIAKCWIFNYLAIWCVVPLGLEPRTP